MGEAVVINIHPKCDRKTQLSKDIFCNALKTTQILSILSQQIKTTVLYPTFKTLANPESFD